jgi:hypothetical protein
MHRHGDFAILAKIEFRIRTKHARIRIIRRALQPDVVSLLPDFFRLGGIECHGGAAGDGEKGATVLIDEDKSDVLVGVDLVVLGTAYIGHEPDEAGNGRRRTVDCQGAATSLVGISIRENSALSQLTSGLVGLNIPSGLSLNSQACRS